MKLNVAVTVRGFTPLPPVKLKAPTTVPLIDTFHERSWPTAHPAVVSVICRDSASCENGCDAVTVSCTKSPARKRVAVVPSVPTPPGPPTADVASGNPAVGLGAEHVVVPGPLHTTVPVRVHAPTPVVHEVPVGRHVPLQLL